VIGAYLKQGIVILVEHNSGYALIGKVINKTLELVCSASIPKLSPLATLVKTITFVNGKKFAEHGRIYTALNAPT
jgi:IS30 family transposase